MEEIILIRTAHKTEHSLDPGEYEDFLTRLNKIRYQDVYKRQVTDCVKSQEQVVSLTLLPEHSIPGAVRVS